MIIIRVMGGLGNQLFQYALYELLLLNGQEACLDISHYAEDGTGDKRPLDLLLFQDLQIKSCSEREKCKYLDERHTIIDKVRQKLGITYFRATLEKGQYMPEIFSMRTGYLQGYWNSERYSGRIEKDLQKKLVFPQPVDEKTKRLAEKIITENSVSIHIRRGDYLTPENVEIFGGICTEEYYSKAVEFMKKKIDQPVFYVFCEDTAFVRAHIKSESICIVDWNTGRNSIYDMYLMSLCRGNICANSTFSVWASKLNKRKDRIRIRPERLDNLVQQGQDEIDALKKNQWILIDSKGKEV